ncbi:MULTISPECIES: hypothetical protein [Legionella]|uniref:Tetratricopeptide repeat protein n=1 Tax=Legionella resiliens TaxID=2905958 RepID=A0ABS8X086_9GAMM|nr:MULTISPECIES: hypothetical protein [unclassified Legionella]MCE0723010.1 hypothetical protein [Legionella sp. 9fVS26]MCE3532163.1 hypothetical protein [Legionella sp. 8cVS16]QLZ68289.1 hypothetical protein FOLKNPGA_01067 [Legionella sp. PC1000]
MDEEYRKYAKSKITNAKYLERKHAAKKIIIDEYTQGINAFLRIINKTPADFHDLTNAYYDLATFYFNKTEYVKAGQCYLDAIKQLLHTELNDESYRKLTELYIDLADACYESVNQLGGDEAMSNAIKAFGLIKNKTIDEQRIGDPAINFQQFHAYYEKKLSTKSYLASSKFANHEHLLAEGQFARQEQSLFEQFGAISISEMQQIDHSIESMLNQLSLSADKHPFNPVLINETPSDSAYRNMAMQLLALAKSHVQNKRITDTIETYKHAIRTLQTIKVPQKSDHEIIQHLQGQVEYLRKKPGIQETQFSFTTPSSLQESQRSVSATQSGRGFFAQSLHEESKEDNSMEFDKDFEMDVDGNGMNM